MLVYCNNPDGILHLAGFRIRGKNTGYDPVDIPFYLYNACKEGYLRSKLGYPCPEVAFTYSELRFLPDKTLLAIADACAVRRKKDWGRKHIVDAIKIKLRDISPCL